MRLRIILVLVLGLVLVAPAAARANQAGVHLKKCETGPAAEDRSATFKSWMNAVPGTERMAVRFKLVTHSEGQASPHSLTNEELSSWHRSRRGVTRYVYSQKVKGLRPGTSYRMVVSFRWYDADGNEIKRAKRRSAACVQPGGLPNLVVSSVAAFPGPATGTAIYAVSVRNRGQGPAEGFTVALIVDGALADSRTIERLGPGESATTNLNGPTCNRLRAVVDREHVVTESVEDDNALTATC